jgi:hypothetical protein
MASGGAIARENVTSMPKRLREHRFAVCVQPGGCWWGDGACVAADEFGEHESIFLLTHTNEFVGTCKRAPEPTPACCGVNQCRRVYEGQEKKLPQGGLPGLLGTSFLGVSFQPEALYLRRDCSYCKSSIATGPTKIPIFEV